MIEVSKQYLNWLKPRFMMATNKRDTLFIKGIWIKNPVNRESIFYEKHQTNYAQRNEHKNVNLWNIKPYKKFIISFHFFYLWKVRGKFEYRGNLQ